MKKMRRFLSAIMALVMVVGVLAMPALAITADKLKLVAQNVTVDGTEDKPVNVVFAATEATNIMLLQGNFSIKEKEDSSYFALTGMEVPFAITANNNYTLQDGQIMYLDDTNYAGYDVEANGNIATAIYTVDKNTPSGEYTVEFVMVGISDNQGGAIQDETTFTATINVTNTAGNDDGDEGTTSAYTAAVTSTTTKVAVDDEVIVNVGVDTTTGDAFFNAAEVVLTYPADLLDLDESSLSGLEYKPGDGTVTIEDFGADKNFGTGAYAVKFTAIADGTAEVTLTGAAFVHKDNANKSDLIPADITTETVEIEISKKTYDVTLPEDADGNVIVEGETTVTDGENYTFTLPDTDKYVYDVDEMVVTVGGTPVTPSKEGESYTITDVTGPVVITGISREYRSYKVTFAGNAADEVTDGALTATYNTPYTFTKPSAENFNYTVSITIGGTAYTAFSEENNVITIPGDVILGDIKITVEKVQTKFTVTVEKDEGIEATWNPTVVDEGNDVVLTITRVTGYTYKVTATMGGNDVEVKDNQDGTYTVENVTGNIVFKIEALLNVGGIVVQRYLTLDGSVMWLVTNENTMDEDKVPAYNGEAMFWSEKYNAYCYLVVADTLALGSLEDEITTDALDMISIIDGTATEVDYGMDVNKSGKVDAADAQFTYNMYNSPYYTGFDADNTVEKFLRADVNGDKNVNVSDADAIITRILS